MNKLSSIQELRGIAALAVTLTHINFIFKVFDQFIPSFGVDIFFILSGFIMSWVLQTPKHTVKSFLINRYKRIYPLYFNVTLIVFIVSIFLGTSKSFVDLISSLLFIPFEKATWKDFILVPGWTLFFEILFYFIVSIRLQLGLKAYYFVLLIWLIIITIGQFIFLEINYLFVLLASFNIEFIMGVLLFHLYLTKFKINNTIFLFISVLLLIILSFVSTDEGLFRYVPRDTIAFGDQSLPRVIGWGLPSFLFVLLYLKSPLKKNTFLYDLGEISYSIYLSQYIIIGIFINIFKYLQFDIASYSIVTKLILILFLIQVIIWLSRFSCKFFERKFFFQIFNNENTFNGKYRLSGK